MAAADGNMSRQRRRDRAMAIALWARDGDISGKRANFAILFTEYGTVLQYGNIVWYITYTLYHNTLTILSACGRFLFSRKSVARGALNHTKMPPSPKNKCLSGAAPIGLLCVINKYTVCLNIKYLYGRLVSSDMFTWRKHTQFIPWYFESLLSKRNEYLLGSSQMFTQQAGEKFTGIMRYWQVN